MESSRPAAIVWAVAVLALSLGAAAAGGERPGSPTCFGQAPTIVADRFHVEGTPRDDVILDVDGGGLVEAGAGADLICMEGNFAEVYAGAGADKVATAARGDLIYPDAGDDLVIAGDGRDLVTDTDGDDDVHRGGAGYDRIRFSSPYARGKVRPVKVDLRRGRAAGHGRDRLAGFEAVEGTARPDLLAGDGADNALDGIRGGDRILGRSGDDSILGADVLVTEAGDALGRFDGADRSLRGGSGDDRIYGRAGRDRLSGGPGDDLLDAAGPRGTRPGDGGDGGGGRDRCRGLEAARSCER